MISVISYRKKNRKKNDDCCRENIWIRRVDDFCPHNQALGYGGWFESDHAFFVLLGQKVFMLRENIH